MSKLLLIRHAQASLLAADYDNLSEKGYAQSELLGEYLSSNSFQFDKIYMGTLRRHRQTFETVQAVYETNHLSLPSPIPLEELNEHRGMETMDQISGLLAEHYPTFRAWNQEMKTNPTAKLKMKIVDTFLNIWAKDDFKFDFPEGVQRFSDFNATARRGLDKVLQGNEQGKNIAVFSSGGCIGAMLGKVLGMEDPVKVMGLNLVMVNAAMSEVLFSGNRISLKTFNHTPHLTEEMVTTM